MRNDSIPKVALRRAPPERRKPGRPKTTWRTTVMAELQDMGLSWGETPPWRSIVVPFYPTGEEENK